MSESPITDLTRGVYRRLYGGFIYGQRINKISMEAECWFWRLHAAVDDFGNMPADPTICYNMTVGNRKRIKPEQVKKWLKEMESVNLIVLYADKTEQFLHVVGFENAQPAGKNGKRIKRFAECDLENRVNAGESRCIQMNPDLSSASQASDNDNDHHTDNDTDTERLTPPFCGIDFLSTLASFEQHRKEIKKPLKATGLRLLYEQLRGMGELPAVAAMKTSIANGWQGVFAERGNNGTSQQRNGYKTAAEKRGEQFNSHLAIIAELRGEGGGDNSEIEGGESEPAF